MTKVVSLEERRKAKETQEKASEIQFTEAMDIAVNRLEDEGWVLDQEGGFFIKGYRLHTHGATILFKIEELADLMEYEGLIILDEALRMKEVYALSLIMERMLDDEKRGDWLHTLPQKGGEFDGK